MPRVATFNVHDCYGRDGRHDVHRVAEVLVELDADLLALQEVTVDDAGQLTQIFGSTTALQVLDGSLFDRGLGRYGNLLLTRYTVREMCLHDLSFAGREQRGCLQADLACEGTRFRALATHLGLCRRERRAQLQRLAQCAADTREACVILGDLNSWVGAVALRPLRAAGFGGPAVRSFPTWPGPLLALDRILVRPPAKIVRCWRHDSHAARMASDHFPVVAEIEMDC